MNNLKSKVVSQQIILLRIMLYFQNNEFSQIAFLHICFKRIVCYSFFFFFFLTALGKSKNDLLKILPIRNLAISSEIYTKNECKISAIVKTIQLGSETQNARPISREFDNFTTVCRTTAIRTYRLYV